ncbi:hypothetical protein LXL04_024511 [Taraxacum kok-saghyz]
MKNKLTRSFVFVLVFALCPFANFIDIRSIDLYKPTSTTVSFLHLCLRRRCRFPPLCRRLPPPCRRFTPLRCRLPQVSYELESFFFPSLKSKIDFDRGACNRLLLCAVGFLRSGYMPEIDS